jgi:uncharacterized membrane protein
MRMAPQAPQTLDGLAYMRYATYYEGSTPMPLGDDLDIIDWLQDNVQGTPAIIEAHQYPSEYRLNGRISISTGLPTVLGWRFHQQQQRTLDPLPNLVVQRGANVISFYNTPDIGTAWRMLKFFDVQYIIAAKLERATYAPEGLAKFDQMAELKLLEVVYDKNGGDRIYRVIPTATYVDTQLGRTIQPADVDIPRKGG